MKSLLLATFAVMAAHAQSPRVVAVPETLRPGPNEVLATVLGARGVQIYECREGKWVFLAPEADLFDTAGRQVGRHYEGPHWEAADGGPGSFSRVTSIQRVSTTGGVAPAGRCLTAGVTARVPYTADYYLFAPR